MRNVEGAKEHRSKGAKAGRRVRVYGTYGGREGQTASDSVVLSSFDFDSGFVGRSEHNIQNNITMHNTHIAHVRPPNEKKRLTTNVGSFASAYRIQPTVFVVTDPPAEDCGKYSW